MRIVFSDESGTGSEIDEPNLVVSALVVNLDSQWPALPQDLEFTLEGQGLDPAKYEIKGAGL